MQEEVNKLIFNTLISQRMVYLPRVGTLVLVCREANVASSGVIEPPRYIVEFSSHTEAISLIDVIANVAGVNVKTATDIYDRWLEKVKTAECLVIGGVGELRNKSFIIDEEFDRSINILSPVKVRKKGSAITIFWYIMTLILMCGAAFAVYYVLTDKSRSDVYSIEESHCADASESQTVMQVEPIETAEVATADTLSVDEQPITVADQLIDVKSSDWRESVDIRHWVVVGSYSTEENARRAVLEIEKRLADVHCSVFRLGSMYAVSVYGSADKLDCERFIDDYIKEFNQAWIHTPRKFRE